MPKEDEKDPSPYSIREATEADGPRVIEILNHYIENSMAAYPEWPVSAEFFTMMRAGAASYPFYVLECESKIVGFGYMRPYHPASTFRRTALLTYFILPDHTGKGLGARLLDRLTDDARWLEVDSLLAHISSANEASLRFHLKHGFQECGRFRRIGRKWEEDFDIVWVQKLLDL